MQLTEYFSDDMTKSAVINKEGTVYSIDFFQDGVKVGTRVFSDHTLQYVEDAAENYTLGILKIIAPD